MKSISIVVISLLSVLAACSSENKFKGGVAAADANPAAKAEEPATPEVDPVPEPTPAPLPKKVIKTLELTALSTSSPIDMVWVVDNSGSMKEEVAQVRANIQKFAKSVSERADLRLSLISDQDPRFGLTLDEMSLPKDFLQVKTYVGSINSMSILASALCDKEGTVLEGTVVKKICAKDVVSTRENEGIYPNSRISMAEGLAQGDHQASVVSGSLKDRMRAGATRVFVFVTDDTTKGAVVGNNFMSVTGSDPATTHVYAFAGIKKTPGCDIAKVGETYLELARATGGEVFDICASDWSANFTQLTEKVIKLTQNSFDIPGSIKVIKDVKIKGQVLNSKQYVFAGGKLIILDKTVLSENEIVVIEYEVEGE